MNFANEGRAQEHKVLQVVQGHYSPCTTRVDRLLCWPEISTCSATVLNLVYLNIQWQFNGIKNLHPSFSHFSIVSLEMDSKSKKKINATQLYDSIA